MQTEMPTRGLVARESAPDVFENFMSVEKVGSVEQIDTSVEVAMVERYGHRWLAPHCGSVLIDNLHVFVD
jgi:hypothetical protein